MKVGIGLLGRRGIGSLRNLRTFSSLQNRNYRLYFIGMAGQWIGINMEVVTRSLLIYRLTGSAALLGLMSLTQAISMLLLSLFGGVISDRVQKKKVIIISTMGLAAVYLGLGLVLTLGYLSPERPGSWWILIVSSVFQGGFLGFFMPSRQAIISEIVNREQVMNAVALNSLGMNTLRFLAPALAGFLIDAFDFEAVYYSIVVTYLFAVIFIALVPPTGKVTIRTSGTINGIREGFRYVRRETIVFLILIFTVLVVVLSGPYQYLLPILTEDVLRVGATELGILMSASGVGAMVGSLAIASLPNKKRGAILIVSSLILGIALACFSFSRSWYLSLVLIALVGLGTAGRQSLGSILLQCYTKSEYLGRVMSLYMMEFGLMSLGTFTAGLLTELIGVEWTLGGFAMTLSLLSILALVFAPRLRKLD
ncbi:MFS transporter [Chloroflexota bacterium]